LGSEQSQLISAVAIAASRGVAVWLAVIARRRLTGRSERLALGFLAAGLVTLLFADGWRILIAAATGEAPSIPSVSDLLSLAGYLAMVAFLVVYPPPRPERFSRAKALLDVLIIGISVFTLAWVMFVQPVSAVGMESATRLGWLALAPMFDLILLGLCLRQVLIHAGYPALRGFAALGAAATLLAAADLLHATSVLLGEGVMASFAWIVTVAANLFAAWGASRLGPRRARPQPSVVQGGLAWRLEALLPVGLTYVVVGFTVFNWWAVGQVDWLAVGASVTLVLLLVSRQGVIAGQRELRQHAALVDAAADMAFVAGLDGRVVFANPALREAVGGRDDGSSPPLPEFLLAGGGLEEMLRSAHADGWSGEAIVRRESGKQVPVLLTLRPVALLQPGAPLLAGIAHDLTGIKQRQQELQAALAEVAAARQELEQLNEGLEAKVLARTEELERTVADLARLNEELQALDKLKTEFVSLVSHELRAPLTNIRTGIELLLGGAPELPGGVEETLSLVQGEARRLTRFVEAILDVSALEAGKFSLRPRPVDLRLTARNTLAGFSDPRARERVRVVIPDSMPDLQADELALQSVLFHLLDNALKYAPDGAIEVTAEVRQGRGEVRVRDHGPGIPEGETERVFDIFHRLDSRDSREVYGHGLGLHLVRRLIEAMGGEILAGRPPDGGLCMTFWLPLADASTLDPASLGG
jgi:PAS domain S-box-containing protein